MTEAMEQAAFSDLWFAYAYFNYDGTGENLGETADSFMESLKDIEAKIPQWLDQEWLTMEYHKRL